MHGLGADGNDFVPIVHEFGLDGLRLRFVFPHAPLQPVTINGGYVMRAWYDIGYEDLSLKEDEKITLMKFGNILMKSKTKDAATGAWTFEAEYLPEDKDFDLGEALSLKN